MKTQVKSYQSKYYFAGIIVGCIVLLVPILLFPIPPLVDYPNHLARAHILANLDSAPLLAQYYISNWNIVPNLGMDLVVTPLAMFLPTLVAGRLFLALIVVGLVTGCFFLHYTLHQRLSIWPFVAFLIVYNRSIFAGLMSYWLGIGIGLWLFSFWILLRTKPSWLRLLVFFCGANVLFVTHFVAFGLYLFAVISYELVSFWSHRQVYDSSFKQAAITFTQFLLPLVLFFFFSPTSVGGSEISFGYSPSSKIVGILHLFHNYSHLVDGATSVVLWTLLGWGFYTKSLRLNRKMIFVLVAMIALYLVTPFWVLTAYCLDIRLFPAIAFFFLASIDFRKKLSGNTTFVLLMLVVVFIGRMGILTYKWQQANAVYSKFDDAFEKIEPGKKLATAFGWVDEKRNFPTPLLHISCLTVIRKSTFVPYLFAHPSQQPMNYLPGYPQEGYSNMLNRSDWSSIIENYDYLLMIDEHLHKNPPPRKDLKLVHKDDRMILYEIRHPS